MLLQPRFHRRNLPVSQQINGVVALQITDQRPVAQSALVWSGKGSDVATAPSPKNRAGGFLHTRLKPFSPPVSPDAASPRINLGCELVGDRWGEAIPDFLPDPIPLLTAITYDDYAIR